MKSIYLSFFILTGKLTETNKKNLPKQLLAYTLISTYIEPYIETYIEILNLTPSDEAFRVLLKFPRRE